ncbi:MAG: T9SS type A sorting domain-containing protein [Chitinophagales bacterium]|nr:T9SS type A sorting domain-containing protein [Chitinophagales bacterium]
MQQSLLKKVFFLAAILLSGALQAQLPVPFWSENFTNGLPSGWTTTDGSNQGVLWTWCADPILGDNDPGCSQPWDDALNGQQPFNATTASTGFMVMDSDDPGGLPTEHISRLTTAPINCAGKNEVFVTFQTHIGVYEFDADANAILRVSTNGTTWTDYPVFNGLTTTVRWSQNPEIPIIDISATAANAGTVYLQWQWTGNWEYMWSVDDVEVYGENPSPRNDLAIDAFFYPASSFAQPESQIASDVFAFEVNLDNNGLNAQTNIVVTAYVKEDGGATLHTQTITIPELAAGVQDSAFTFPDLYTPALPNGAYLIGYTLTADSLDQRPVDNQQESPFVVSNNVFAKEDGPEQGYRPSAGGDWAVANLYSMGAGEFDKYKATQAEFAFTTNEDDIAVGEVEAALYLFKVSSDVAPDFSNFDGSGFLTPSLEWLGVANYEAPDTLQGYELQRVDLSDLNTGLAGVVLEPETRYLLAIEYANASASAFHAFNDDVYYFFPSTFVFNTDWNPFGFGGDVNAVLRLYISLISTTDETMLPENTINVFPNPVRETVQLGIEFAEPTDATITIADISGRVIHVEDRKGLTMETIQYRLPQLSSGTYLARIATANGTLTKKFVVQK